MKAAATTAGLCALLAAAFAAFVAFEVEYLTNQTKYEIQRRFK